MPVLFRANTELVAGAWLGGVTGLSPSMVATQLPDVSKWATTGFVTYRTTGGQPAVDYPMRAPAVTIDTWAVNVSSAKAPWNVANKLAEFVVRACQPITEDERIAVQRTLTLPTNYPAAVVKSVWVLEEPRRAYGDVGNYAHYVMSIALRWVDLT